MTYCGSNDVMNINIAILIYLMNSILAIANYNCVVL